MSVEMADEYDPNINFYVVEEGSSKTGVSPNDIVHVAEEWALQAEISQPSDLDWNTLSQTGMSISSGRMTARAGSA